MPDMHNQQSICGLILHAEKFVVPASAKLFRCVTSDTDSRARVHCEASYQQLLKAEELMHTADVHSAHHSLA